MEEIRKKMEEAKEAMKDFWEKAEVRRRAYLDRGAKQKDATAEALYALCAELCCLEQLMMMWILKP